jgi:hypothetical protein
VRRYGRITKSHINENGVRVIEGSEVEAVSLECEDDIVLQIRKLFPDPPIHADHYLDPSQALPWSE